MLESKLKTDEEIMMAFQNGDNSAFDELFTRYKLLFMGIWKDIRVTRLLPRTFFSRLF